MMKTLSALMPLSLLIIAAVPSGAAVGGSVQQANAGATLTLAQNGKSEYVIALAADAIPAEKTAARELSGYLEKISGVKIGIRSETAVLRTQPQILVGAGKRVKALLPQQNWAALGNDGIIIKTSGRNLILAGGRPRGSLYAVYSFLEDSLGVRWWTPTESKVPTRKALKIPLQSLTYRPQLQTREAFYNSVQQDPIFATRLKNNGDHQTQTQQWGGKNTILGFVHTFDKLLPPEKYFKDHPEWYSDPTNGGKPCTVNSPMPKPQQSQLCLTNEAARRELTENALAWIRENPEAGMISISQNDNNAPCTCEADMAIQEREGSPAGPLLEFVNKVAADIEKEYPGFLVETLAYQYTRKAPKTVRPRGNVMIRLCSIEADFSRPFNSVANQSFHDDVVNWKNIAPRLFIWDYLTNFNDTILPHPNLKVMGPNLRFLVANNAIGLFAQGDAYSNGTGDFVAMRVWVLSHLMWNPALDQKKLEDEFLREYYGAAAPHLRTYLTTIEKAFAQSGGRLSTFQEDHSYLDLNTLNTATRQFRLAASAVAGEKILSARVRRERLALDHAWILRGELLRREAKVGHLSYEGPQDFAEFIRDFVATARKFDTYSKGEGMPFEAYAEPLLARALSLKTSAPPLPDFVRGKSEADVMDVQEGNFKIYYAGKLGDIVPDVPASNGRAAKMVGNAAEWITQFWLGESEVFKDGPWHCYAFVRVQPRPGAVAGPALTCGIYDIKNKKLLVTISKSLAEVGGDDYQVVDLGKHTLHSQSYIYVSPPNRDDIEAVFVDRILLVREPS
jgi:hypothetical protein